MSITAANAIFTLKIAGLYEVPQRLQQFATDDIFDADPNEIAETAMGVDGFLTAGFVNNQQSMKVHLQADSESHAIFEAWNAAQRQVQDIYYAEGAITLRGIQRKFDLEKGVLRSWQPIPSAKKTLQPRIYELVWERITMSPMGR